MLFPEFLQIKLIFDTVNNAKIDEFAKRREINTKGPSGADFFIDLKLMEMKSTPEMMITKIEELLQKSSKTSLLHELCLLYQAKNYLLQNKFEQMKKYLQRFSEERSKNQDGNLSRDRYLNALSKLISARYHIKMKEFSVAVTELKELTSFFSLPEYQAELAESLNLQAKILYYQQNFQAALQYLEKVSSIYQKLNNWKHIAWIQNNIGLIQYQLGHFQEATKNLQEAKHASELLGDRGNIANTLNNLGLIYFNSGRFALSKNSYTQSLKYYSEMEDEEKIAYLLSNLGEVSIYLREPHQAKEFLMKAGDIFKRLNLEFHSIEPFHSLFRLALIEDNEDRAMMIYNQMLSIRNKYPTKVDDAYLKLVNLQFIARFKDISNLQNILPMIKELVVNPKIRIEFRFQALIMMAKILNDTMITENTSAYMEDLKALLNQMQQIAKKTFSFFTLGISYVVLGNIAIIEQRKDDVIQNLQKLEEINNNLKLNVFSEAIDSFKSIKPTINQNNSLEKPETNPIFQQIKDMLSQLI